MEEMKVCKCCGRELPLSMFSHNKFGEFNVCKECIQKKRAATNQKGKQERNYEQEIADAKKMRLSEFTPRELMLRLKELGYIGYIDIQQTVYKRIDLSTEF